jgi:hypothetical protein
MVKNSQKDMFVCVFGAGARELEDVKKRGRRRRRRRRRRRERERERFY